jgi:glycerol-3-phosphate cytidylyltransferase
MANKTVGYLSGTFDLFHVGHLNLLQNARALCDYLAVGINKDATHKGKRVFIPFEERLKIVQSIRYVDRAIPAPPEDSDAYGEIRYDCLFVGDDYKNSERFNRYEAFFKNTRVKIIYLPYTQHTSSSELRALIAAAIL